MHQHQHSVSHRMGWAWLLNILSGKSHDSVFTYGYHRFSLLGALINGAVLIAGSLWVLTEAIPRLAHPEMPDAQGMIGLALLGVSVNGYAAYKLSHGKTLNERVLNWYLLEDVFGWCAVRSPNGVRGDDERTVKSIPMVLSAAISRNRIVR